MGFSYGEDGGDNGVGGNDGDVALLPAIHDGNEIDDLGTEQTEEAGGTACMDDKENVEDSVGGSHEVTGVTGGGNAVAGAPQGRPN